LSQGGSQDSQEITFIKTKSYEGTQSINNAWY